MASAIARASVSAASPVRLLPLHRRSLLSIPLLPFLLAASPAHSSVSRRVSLKEVENPKLQEALRAAVAGDLETADAMFSELILEDPQSASVWSNRGSVRLSLRHYEEALSDLNRAVQLAPQAPVPLLNRAIALEVSPSTRCSPACFLFFSVKERCA
jgi:regulator of sirC expression with transglutaminase-like and TPR domain